MKKLSLLFLITAFFTLRAERSSVSDNNEYPRFCQMAALDPQMFANFRQSHECRKIIETVGAYDGQEYLRITLQQTPHFHNLMPIFKKSDTIGNPGMILYDNYDLIAPTTLRYIKVASDLFTMFGTLDDFTIIEIGGGYGGQCKIIHDAFKCKRYIIVDLPGPLALAKKFLESQGIKNVIYVTPDLPVPVNSCDLVISNYAYSELTAPFRKKYIDTIIQFAKRGYLTCNVAGSDLFASKQQLLQELTQNNVPWIELEEKPLTDPHNYLVCWTR